MVWGGGQHINSRDVMKLLNMIYVRCLVNVVRNNLKSVPKVSHSTCQSPRCYNIWIFVWVNFVVNEN